MSLTLSTIKIDDGTGNNTTADASLSFTGSDTSLAIEKIDPIAGNSGYTFTPKVPDTLKVEGDFLKSVNGGIGFGSVSKTDLRALLGINNVDNTADADKPVSVAAQTAIDAKHDKITAANKLDMQLVDGLGNTLGQLATKAELQAATATASLGIKYEWPNVAAQTAQTGMLNGEQGVLVGTDGARDVYQWNGSTWFKVYTLSAAHNHDDRYYTKQQADSAMSAKLDKSGSLSISQITDLSSQLNSLVPKSQVQTAVPAGALFTDQNWSGADAALQRVSVLENSLSAAKATTSVVISGDKNGGSGIRNAVPLDDFLSMIIDPDLDSFYLVSNGVHIDTATGKHAEFKIRAYMRSMWEDPDHNSLKTTGRKCDLKANGVENGGLCGFLYRSGVWKDPRDCMAWQSSIVLQTTFNGRIHYRRYEVEGTVMRLPDNIGNKDRMLIHTRTHKCAFNLNGDLA